MNFRHPYFSGNIAEFWRRWHITLSNWLRDYLYIPLGGNRGGPWSTYRNLLLTMTLGGLWHGASWNFVLWGLLHGVALSVTRFVHERRGVEAHEPLFHGWIYRGLAVLVTFHVVCLGWIFFRAATFDQALSILRGLARFKLIGSGDLVMFGWVVIGVTAAYLGVIAVLHYIAHRAREAGFHRTPTWAALRPLAYAFVVVGILLFATSGAQQFIYFQF